LLWVTADTPLLRSRIDDRAASGQDPSDATTAVLENQREFAQAPGGQELADTIRVDTGVAVDLDGLVALLRGPDVRRPAGDGS
jgi:predicted kinase